MIDLNVEFGKQGSVSVSSSKKIGCSVTRFDKISPRLGQFLRFTYLVFG